MSPRDPGKENTETNTATSPTKFHHPSCIWCGGDLETKQTTPVNVPGGDQEVVLLLACKECSRMDMRGDTDAVVVSLLLTLSHFMEKSITMEKVLQLGLVAGGGIGTKEWEELARETLEKEGTR